MARWAGATSSVVSAGLGMTSGVLRTGVTSGVLRIGVTSGVLRTGVTSGVLRTDRKPGEILDDFNLFLEEFGSFIRLVKNINRSSYICGDYNIGLLKIKTNKHFNEFFDNLITTVFSPKITLPTRFTEQSSTLIDNVFSNNIEERETSGILLNHISNHQLLFTYIEKLSYIERVPKDIDVEKSDTISIAKFVKELNDGNIYDQLLKPIDSNPHENYDTFMKIIQQAKDTHLPRKTVKFKKKKHKKSKWMTYGI